MTPDQQPKNHHSEAPQTHTSTHSSSRPPKYQFLDDAIGIAIGISVGWLGEIAMQSAGFTLFALS